MCVKTETKKARDVTEPRKDSKTNIFIPVYYRNDERMYWQCGFDLIQNYTNTNSNFGFDVENIFLALSRLHGFKFVKHFSNENWTKSQMPIRSKPW